jgi:hypothetical protein
VKVTHVKAFVYADNIMIYGDNMKELKMRLASCESEQELQLRDKLGEDSNV